MATRDKQELVDAFRVSDDEGTIYTVEVWVRVSYSSDQDPSTGIRGANVFYLRDGTRLFRNDDHTFTHLSTGRILRYLPTE
jgi:hypothetical protein